MDSFFSLKQSLVKLVYTFFLSDPYIRLHTEIDDGIYFASRVHKHTDMPCTYFQNPTVDGHVPNFFHTAYSLHFNGRTVSGGSTNLNKAISGIKAKAEALERFSSFFPLNSLKKYFDKSYIEKIREKKNIAASVLGFRFKLLKNESVYFGFPQKNVTEEERNTNGYAGHFSRNKAVLNALLELIERDAFLMYWLNTISPAKISLDDFSSEDSRITSLLRSLQMHNLEYYFLDITSDLPIPVCLCVIVKPSKTGRRYFLGTAAGFNMKELILSSAGEAVAILSSKFKNTPFILEKNYEPFVMTTLRQHERMKIYFTHEMEKNIAFLIKSNEYISTSEFISVKNSIPIKNDSSEKAQLAYIKSIFKKRLQTDKRWEVWVVNIKNKLLDEFGFYVVRVLCDALYSIYLTESNANPHHPRLREFVQAKGFENKAQLNIWPHPFP